jgi:hypothetical protein
MDSFYRKTIQFQQTKENQQLTNSCFLSPQPHPSSTPLPRCDLLFMMDEDLLEIEKARIEEEIRKRRRANAKAQKEEEERALIAAAKGRVSSDIAIFFLKTNLTMKGPRKAKEKAKKEASES